jgi:hypothetical protein
MHKLIAIALLVAGLLHSTNARPEGVTGTSAFSIQLKSATTHDLRVISNAIAEQQGFKKVGSERDDVDDRNERIPVAEYRRRNALFHLSRYRVPAGCVLVEFFAWGRSGEQKISKVREQLIARFGSELSSSARVFRHEACGHAL